METVDTSMMRVILREIDASGGMIPFRRFMELALYHPDQGYYSSGRARVGKEGDFFTSVSVGRIYGRLLASVCRETWETLNRPDHFTIVEQGANDGSMAADILEVLAVTGSEFSEVLDYVIVEPFPVNETRQREKLSAWKRVSWVDSPESLPEFTGIHLSNELLDAFPVDALKWNGSEWMEECICREGDSIGWTTRGIGDPSLQETVRQLPVDLAPGWRMERSPEITHWLRTIFAKMQRGVVLTVDYGQAGEDRFAPHRSDGTLLSYRSHQRHDDPLAEPGLRDITAQVDFTDLAEQAAGQGFDLLGYSDQHHFLVGAAEPWLRSMGDLSPESDASRQDLRSLQTLLNPSTMGRQFKAILLGKDFPATPSLSCLRYQRPGVSALSTGGHR
jgi:SAM-dependent MidA family methyltransferase